MNLLVTINNAYVPYTAAMLRSLADSNSDLSLNVYIVCPDITEENKMKLSKQFSNESGGGRICRNQR